MNPSHESGSQNRGLYFAHDFSESTNVTQTPTTLVARVPMGASVILTIGRQSLMRTDYRFRAGNYSHFFPNGVKWLLISNIAIFVLFFFTAQTELGQVFQLLALSPRLVLEHFAIWQLVTYMFLHGGFGHILFNMLTLWMFGMDLERTWAGCSSATLTCACGSRAWMPAISCANIRPGSCSAPKRNSRFICASTARTAVRGSTKPRSAIYWLLTLCCYHELSHGGHEHH